MYAPAFAGPRHRVAHSNMSQIIWSRGIPLPGKALACRSVRFMCCHSLGAARQPWKTGQRAHAYCIEMLCFETALATTCSRNFSSASPASYLLLAGSFFMLRGLKMCRIEFDASARGHYSGCDFRGHANFAAQVMPRTLDRRKMARSLLESKARFVPKESNPARPKPD